MGRESVALLAGRTGAGRGNDDSAGRERAFLHGHRLHNESATGPFLLYWTIYTTKAHDDAAAVRKRDW